MILEPGPRLTLKSNLIKENTIAQNLVQIANQIEESKSDEKLINDIIPPIWKEKG